MYSGLIVFSCADDQQMVSGQGFCDAFVLFGLSLMLTISWLGERARLSQKLVRTPEYKAWAAQQASRHR